MQIDIMLISICFLALQAFDTKALEKDEVEIAKLNALFGTNYQGQIYSGYLSANDGSVEFHYLFYLAINSASEKPLILWLLGGQECSSMIAAFTESDPYTFISESIQFEENAHTWTAFASMLYIESPISIGYSYGPAGAQCDESTAAYKTRTLIEFFVRFPNFKNYKFYIGGESYAGIYVPTLIQEIIKYNSYQLILKSQELTFKVQQLEMVAPDPSEYTSLVYLFPRHRLDFYGRHGFINGETYTKQLIIQKNATNQQNHNAKPQLMKLSLNCWTPVFLQFELIQCLDQMHYLHSRSKRMKSPLRVSDEEKEDSNVLPCVYHWFYNDEVRTVISYHKYSSQ